MLAANNPILDVPSKQRYSFRFDFSGWNVSVLQVLVAEVETRAELPFAVQTQRKKQAQNKIIIFLLTEPCFSDRKKVGKYTMGNKGQKT